MSLKRIFSGGSRIFGKGGAPGWIRVAPVWMGVGVQDGVYRIQPPYGATYVVLALDLRTQRRAAPPAKPGVPVPQSA